MSHEESAPQVPEYRTDLDALPLIRIRLLNMLFAVIPPVTIPADLQDSSSSWPNL
jgi:hypothetical protein